MSTSAWTVVILVSAVPSLMVLLKELRHRGASTVLWFVALAFYLRFLAAALHEYTYAPLLGPLSLNAMLSVAMLAVGIIVIDRRLLLLKTLWPVYLILSLALGSALLNGALAVGTETITKWLLLLVLMVALVQALLERPLAEVLEVLMRAFALPVILLLASLALGHAKANEIDGSISYIGGYSHEAAFSIILATLLGLTLLRYWQEREYVDGACKTLPLLLFVLLLLVNYRTTVLAMLLPVGLYLFDRFVVRASLPKQLALCLVAGLAVVILPLDLAAQLARFQDLPAVFAGYEELVQRPEYYTDWQRQYLSSRAYLWSQYITAWSDASAVHQLAGLGPDTWKGRFVTYAHNTFVSFLYEMGVLGVIGLAVFFAALLLAARRTLMLLFLAWGFVILNLGTLPLWQVEGIFFASVIAAVAYSGRLLAASTRPSAADELRPSDLGLIRSS